MGVGELSPFTPQALSLSFFFLNFPQGGVSVTISLYIPSD
jgi:hypothetical protein